MEVTVVNLSGTDQTVETIDAPSIEGLPENAKILFASVPESQTLYGVDVVLLDVAPDWSLINDLTVLGIHSPAGELVPEDLIDDVYNRLEGSPLYILRAAPDGTPELIHVRGPNIELLDHAAAVAALRDADINALLLKSGVNLPVTAALHYSGPGGHHYRAFTRPGFALRGTDDFDRVAFWLLPFFLGRAYVIVDHWSMSGLAHFAAAYARRFEPSLQTATTIESLLSYDEDEYALSDRLGRVFSDNGDGKVVILLSVNSSGALARRVRGALRKAHHTRPQIVTLAQTQPPTAHDLEIASLATLPAEYNRLEHTCTECTEVGTPAIPIGADTYLMRLSAFTYRRAIRAQMTAGVKSVVERYAGTGSFGVHRTYVDRRHHAYFVDVGRMIACGQPFDDQLNQRLDELFDHLDAVELVIHPPLPAASHLAQKVHDEIVARGYPAPTMLAIDERELAAQSAPPALLAADRVLLIDDAVITGKRIYAYRRAITKSRRRSGVDGRIDLAALVAIARPRSESALRGTRDVLHDMPSARRFFCVERLILPNWGERDCPWCKELAMLKRLPSSIRTAPLIRNRISNLEHQGTETPFFEWPVRGEASGWMAPTTADEWAQVARDLGTVKYADDWALNAGSVFGDLQGTDLLVSVAAAVQLLRLTKLNGVERESDLDEQFRSPISKVLDPNLYMLGRFYEPILLCAIMRACKAHDLTPPEGDVELEEALGAHLSELATSRAMLGELLVHAALGRIPPVAEFDDVEHATRVAETAAKAMVRARPRFDHAPRVEPA